MKKLIALTILVLVAGAASAVFSAPAEEKPLEYSIVRDIVYTVEDGLEIKGDLFIPEGQGPGPFPGRPKQESARR